MKKLLKLMLQNYPLRDKEGAAGADGGADKNADLAAQLAELKAQLDELKSGKGAQPDPEPKDPSVIEKAQQEALLRAQQAQARARMQDAIKFNFGISKYVEENKDYLTKLSGEIVKTVQAKQFSDEEVQARTLQAVGRRARRGHDGRPALSLTAILAGILILLAILTLLTLWGLLGRAGQPGQPETTPPAASAPADSEPEAPAVQYVPDFVGMTYAQIQANRQYSGIYLFYVTEEYSDSAPAGTVLTQDPAAGTALPEGENTTIRLVISKGPAMVEMPNTIGFTQEGAIRELESRGLVPSCFMVVNDGSYASGCVVACSVEPGTMVESGSTIVVYIAADRDVQITATPENTPESPSEPE